MNYCSHRMSATLIAIKRRLDLDDESGKKHFNMIKFWQKIIFK